MAWIGNILESEFFWGVIVGLLLTVIGSYFLTMFTTWQQRRERKEVLKNFCVDTVTNIREIIDDMVATRSKANQDYLTLLDLEIQVFTRNREHTVYLSKDVRDKVRKFMTDCAIRRAEIGNHLTTFYNRRAVADQYQAQGDTMHAQYAMKDANGSLAQADTAMNALVLRAKDSDSVIKDVMGIR
jgi:hypothetical protein